MAIDTMKNKIGVAFLIMRLRYRLAPESDDTFGRRRSRFFCISGDSDLEPRGSFRRTWLSVLILWSVRLIFQGMGFS